MEKQTISSCATADSVTLYWEPLTDAPGKCFYRILWMAVWRRRHSTPIIQ